MSLITHFFQTFLFIFFVIAPFPLTYFIVMKSTFTTVKQSVTDFLITFILVYCSILVFTALFLGATGWLAYYPFILFESFVFILGFYINYRASLLKNVFSTLRGLFSNLALSRYELILIELLVAILILLSVIVFLSPITDYDSLSYHLTSMAFWYQQQSFGPAPQHIYTLWGYYPYSWNSLCLLFFFPFNEDFALLFPNLLAWGLFVLVVYKLSIECGSSRYYALVASLLGSSSPFILISVSTMMIDLPFASFFLCSVFFLLRYYRSAELIHLAFSLLSGAIMLGIKPTGIFYSVLIASIIFIIIVFHIKTFQAKPIERSHLFFVFIFFAFCFFLGGFWYIKNLINLGNPLGLPEVSLAGFVIFKGDADLALVMKSTSLSRVFNIFSSNDVSNLLWQIYGRLNLPFILSFCCALFLPISIVKSRGQIRILQISLATLIVVSGFIYWNLPFTAVDFRQTTITSWMGGAFRYGFGFIALVSVAASVGMTTLNFKKSIILSMVLMAVVFAFGRVQMPIPSSFGEMLEDKRSVMLMTSFLFLLVSWLLYKVLFLINYHFSKPVLLLFILIFLLPFSYGLREGRDYYREIAYSGTTKFVETQIDKNKDVIGYLGSNRAYLFYGKHLDRKVCYIKTSVGESYEEWYLKIKRLGVTVIGIGPFNPPNLKYISPESADTKLRNYWQNYIEVPWIDSNDSFIRVFGKDLNLHTWKSSPNFYRFKTDKKLLD